MMTARKAAAKETFADMVKRFQDENPDLWESLRLCPLQHGLEEMAKKLK